MLTKKEVQSVVKDFKARVVEIRGRKLVIEIQDERYEELKSRLEDILKLTLDMKGAKKVKNKNVVEFAVSTKSPSKEILDVFSRYYEGTKPAEGYED